LPNSYAEFDDVGNGTKKRGSLIEICPSAAEGEI
jgi:hypothetical protein